MAAGSLTNYHRYLERRPLPGKAGPYTACGVARWRDPPHPGPTRAAVRLWGSAVTAVTDREQPPPGGVTGTRAAPPDPTCACVCARAGEIPPPPRGTPTRPAPSTATAPSRHHPRSQRAWRRQGRTTGPAAGG